MEGEVNMGLTTSEVQGLVQQFGYNEIPEKKKNLLALFVSKFWGLSAWMLEAIIILSFFLHKISDALIVTGLLIFNSIIGFIQEKNAARSVDALKKKLQISVKTLRDGEWKVIPSKELVPGDIIRIRKGDFVPADLKIKEGNLSVDQSALTGESAEIKRAPGDTVYSGATVTKGEATGQITLTGNRTYFGKTVQLVQTARPKSHIEETISKVIKWLLLIVGLLLAVAVVFSLFKGISILEILPLMLVLLLGAIPVALTAMFSVSMAIGSRELVKQGVLITRLNAPDDAASMDVLCVDKTGTLTTNRLTISKLIPAAGVSENELALYGALASQEANHDAIDMAFINYARTINTLDESFLQKSFSPFDAENRRTEAIIKKGNEEFRVIKGSFNTIAALCKADDAFIKSWETKIDELSKSGYRAIAIAKGGVSANPEFMGIVALHDPPRLDSKDLIHEIESLGVTVKMLTGDALPIAREIAEQVELGKNILHASDFSAVKNNIDKAALLLDKNNGIAEVYPEDKYNIVKVLQAKGHIVGMTGDGVNDAPALKQSEVGIAVSNATDVAKGSASVILMEEGLAGVIAPIKIGRMMFERINIWILNKIARTILKTTFIVFSFLMLGKYIVSASAMLIMIFMTDFVKISLSTDNVKFSDRPAKWQINKLAGIGIIVGLMMTLEAFGLLYIGLKYFGLGADEGTLNTFCFEMLLFFALLSIFVVREKSHFWNSRPSGTLLLILVADMIFGIIFSSFGLLGFKAIPLTLTIFILGYTSICSLLINDFIKFVIMKRKN